VKVVLFCGGLGMRLRERTSSVPKPMVTIGDRPILWHIMKYYAYYGHNDFVLCLGYKANAIKEFFLEYNEAVTNDFVLRSGGRNVELLSSDIHDWRITFLDTGLRANIGERLKAVQHHLADEEMFLASYGDCLTDAPLNDFIDDFRGRDRIASFLSVPPPYPLHFVEQDEDGVVTSVESVRESHLWINGGYFILRGEIFDYMAAGEELIEQPFQRLISEGRLMTYPYQGFWAPMDTLRERQELEALAASGRPPWAVWRRIRPSLSLAGQSG
jgi:glucose-1-phosphate cytidylyltransferase